MDRRSFLTGALTGLIAGAVFDPERLLWVPGKRRVFLPKREVLYVSYSHFPGGITAGDVLTPWLLANKPATYNLEVLVSGSNAEGFTVCTPTQKTGQLVCAPPTLNDIRAYSAQIGPMPNRYRNLAIGL